MITVCQQLPRVPSTKVQLWGVWRLSASLGPVLSCAVELLQTRVLSRCHMTAISFPHAQGGWVSYQGVGLRPSSTCFPSCFWAPQWGGELAEAPGAAEVGAQGMGGGTGLEEEEAEGGRKGGGEQS